MARSVIDQPQFQDENAALDFVEAHLWPNGPVCPFCGEQKRVGELKGKTTRPGLRKCYACQKPFTVRMGTIFESSHLPLHLWLQVIHFMCASKKGVSTRQIQRLLRCSMKTAWHLTHRIRAAMAPGGDIGKLGGEGKTVEADETFLTNSPKTKKRQGGYEHKVAMMSLVERGGHTRSFVLPRSPNALDVKHAIWQHVHPESRLVTDGAQYYLFPPVAKHESVNHSRKEYVRGDVHVNTLEGYFSVFKRGMIGTYQKVSEKHLHRYVAEFDFRQNYRERLGYNDVSRADVALQGFKGKRLTYRTIGRQEIGA
ncbi:MAG TPA: IS1595 family transposase [Rhizomicrobium sp.]|jgi:transposase-like protein|nr:IS1595 family transposase [Rhizomicrobium sp.]